MIKVLTAFERFAVVTYPELTKKGICVEIRLVKGRNSASPLSSEPHKQEGPDEKHPALCENYMCITRLYPGRFDKNRFINRAVNYKITDFNFKHHSATVPFD